MGQCRTSQAIGLGKGVTEGTTWYMMGWSKGVGPGAASSDTELNKRFVFPVIIDLPCLITALGRGPSCQALLHPTVVAQCS